VVGGQALAAAGKPRFTQDLDLLVEPTAENAARVGEALIAFGFEEVGRAVRTQFRREKRMATLGVPPVAIDIMTTISGVSFDEAWGGRLELRVGGLVVPFLGIAELVKNKVASARDKDLIDVANLKELLPKSRRSNRSRKKRR
jgi:hypothetical protein